MIAENDLRSLARAKLRDAEALLRRKRYDGAFYLCGYALEMALKARICRTLKWPGFPSSRKEFESLASFKTHDLVILLRLSGIEDKILTHFSVDWAVVKKWTPEWRYRVVGSTSQSDAAAFINAAKRLLRVI